MTSELIAQLEARLAELRAKTFDDLPEPTKTAMEMSNNMLIAEIEDRLGYLRRGEPDPYAD